VKQWADERGQGPIRMTLGTHMYLPISMRNYVPVYPIPDRLTWAGHEYDLAAIVYQKFVEGEGEGEEAEHVPHFASDVRIRGHTRYFDEGQEESTKESKEDKFAYAKGGRKTPFHVGQHKQPAVAGLMYVRRAPREEAAKTGKK
jgi:hypothetical protein